MAKQQYQIPFDQSGNQLEWYFIDRDGKPNAYFSTGLIELRDNFEFEDTLTYIGYGRGRSSITFNFSRMGGERVSMFMSDFDPVVKLLQEGKLTGKFTFVKKGQNFGCKYLGP